MSRIIKNTAWLAGGEVAGRIIRIILILYAARALGAAEWGISSYLLSWAVLFTIGTDIGLTSIIIRQLVQDHDNRRHYLSTFFVIKICLLAAASLIVLFVIPRIGSFPISRVLTVSLAALIFFDSIRLIPTAINKAHERMDREALISIVTQGTILGLGLWLIRTMPSAEGLNIAYAAGSALGTLFALYMVRKNLPGILTSFKWPLVMRLIQDGWPVAVIGLLGSIMLNTDIIMLGWMRTTEEIGYYSAAQKIIFTLYALPAIFASALFPAMARLIAHTTAFKDFFEKTLIAIIMIALPITVGGMLTAPNIIALLYGSAYGSATLSFIILLLTVPTVFITAVVSNALIAHNKQQEFIAYALLGILSNIILNSILIPRWGIEGAAIATVITQVISGAFIWRRMRRIMDFSIARRLAPSAAATAGMALSIYTLQSVHASFFAIMPMASIIYILILYAMREPLLKKLPLFASGNFD